MIPLIECFTELMVYTGLVASGHKTGSIEAMHTSYSTLIERSQDTAKLAGLDHDAWLDGFFPVAAWIDEKILCSEMTDRDAWNRRQLQRQYFNMTNAGEIFFQRVETPASIPDALLAVYDAVLAAGFKGCYYKPHQAGILEDIRTNIVRQLTGKPDMVLPDELFADAYEGVRITNATKHLAVNSHDFRFKGGLIALPVLVLMALWAAFNTHLGHLLSLCLGTGS